MELHGVTGSWLELLHFFASHLSIYLSIYLSICLSICLSTYLSIYLSIQRPLYSVPPWAIFSMQNVVSKVPRRKTSLLLFLCFLRNGPNSTKPPLPWKMYIWIYVKMIAFIYICNYIYVYIRLYTIIQSIRVYTLYNGSIEVNPVCSIWRAIYTMVRVR